MMDKFNLEIRIQFAEMDRENDNEEHNSHSSQSSPKSTGFVLINIYSKINNLF
jgi:hypothetical protein